MDARFLREIDRLFNELIHDPWQRVLPHAPDRPDAASLVLEIPLKGREVESMSVTIEGNRPIVVLCTTSPRNSSASEADRAAERCRQTFELPEGTVPQGVEARFEDGMLRLRVQLQRRNG